MQHDTLLKSYDENKLHEIMHDIHALNEINTRLHTLIHEQTNDINTLECNIMMTSNKIDNGIVELEKAEVYQKKYNFKKFLLVSAGVTAISFPALLFIGAAKAIAVAGAVGLASGIGTSVLKK
jgi:hypothetical protein